MNGSAARERVYQVLVLPEQRMNKPHDIPTIQPRKSSQDGPSAASKALIALPQGLARTPGPSDVRTWDVQSSVTKARCGRSHCVANRQESLAIQESLTPRRKGQGLSRTEPTCRSQPDSWLDCSHAAMREVRNTNRAGQPIFKNIPLTEKSARA